MKSKHVPIESVKTNETNPRIIKDYKFKKLVQSIKAFPKMLELRPIVVNKDMVVLGGNMRLRACQEAGLDKVHIIMADDLSTEEQAEFTIKDNLSFGEWDWEALANNWDNELMEDWGMDIWKPAEEPDYSILDDDNIQSEINSMSGEVKKAIQIEFEQEHYEEAHELIKFWRAQGLYIGGFIIEKLKLEKEKLNAE
jgi:hypothetical protein